MGYLYRKNTEVSAQKGTADAAAVEAWNEIYTAIRDMLGELGLERVGVEDPSTDHTSTDLYFTESYVPTGWGYSYQEWQAGTWDADFYLTVCMTYPYNSASYAGLRLCITSSIPSDGSSAPTGSPQIDRGLELFKAQAGAEYTHRLCGDIAALVNDDACLGFIGPKLYGFYQFDVGHITIGGTDGIYWPSNGAIYTQADGIKYLSSLAYTAIQVNSDTDTRQNDKDTALIMPCCVTGNPSRNAGLNNEDVSVKVLGYAGNIMGGDTAYGQRFKLSGSDYGASNTEYLAYRGLLYAYT